MSDRYVQGNNLYDNINRSEGNNTTRHIPITEYFIKGLFFIKRVLDLLVKSGPFIEEYGPLIRDLTKMYRVMRLLQKEEGEIEKKGSKQQQPLLSNDSRKRVSKQPNPLLYI